MNAVAQAAVVLHQVLGAQRLVGEGHIHHGGGVPLGGGQVDEPALAQQVDAAPVGGGVLLHKGAHLPMADGDGLQRGDVNLHIEMAAVGHDGAVRHCRKVVGADDVPAAGHGDEHFALPRRFQPGHHLKAVHYRF